VVQLGRVHPDEVYQSLEPAWHRVHGYGVLAWEWREGLRNWAMPLLLAGLMRLCQALGVEHPVAVRAVLGLPLLALHLAALVAVFRLVQRRAGTRAAAAAGVLVGLHAPLLVHAGRTLSEPTSTAFVLLAVEALDRVRHARRAGRSQSAGWGLWAGAALGLAVVTRYGSAVLVLAALLWLAGTRQWRPLLQVCAGGAGVALALGALDLATWGRPFHSFLTYVDFNVLSGRAAQRFGAEPPHYYLPLLLRSLPAWLLLAVPLLWRRRQLRLGLPLLAAGLYLAALTATAHKEERFLYPAWVLLSVAGAPAVGAWLARPGAGRGRWVAAGGAVAASLLPFAWSPDVRGDQFRAIVQASRPPATGLLIVNEGLWGAGGYFYLGRNIPWSTCDWPRDAAFRRAMRDARYNRVVTFEGRALPELQAAGFRVVGRVGRETILARGEE
jgi:4-amino-4-deoxy-L-arabinose transferase-like glycosyltransferase